MRPPILAFARGGTLAIYRSAEHAATTLEPVDVLGGVHELFDSLGFRLDVTVGVQTTERMWFGRQVKKRGPVIVIRDHEPRQDESEYVRARLIHYINRRKHPQIEFSLLTMEELIRMAGESMPWQVY